jgi:hypothetical protein
MSRFLWLTLRLLPGAATAQNNKDPQSGLRLETVQSNEQPFNKRNGQLNEIHSIYD